MNLLRVASTQFDFRPLQQPSDFWDRCENLASRASREGARLILFPEYFVLPWLLAKTGGDFQRSLCSFEHYEEEFHREMHALSLGLHIAVVAGSVPQREGDRLVNRCYIYLPDGQRLFQDKRHMTRFESEDWGISKSDSPLTVFDYEGARWSVAIAYDIEFPLYAAEFTQSDVDFILVPACPNDEQGYWRIRHCAQARAVETQSAVVLSCAVGVQERHAELQSHYGRAGFFSPCDYLMPADGVMSLGQLNRENVHIAEYDLRYLHQVRVAGTVLNRLDQLAEIPPL